MTAWETLKNSLTKGTSQGTCGYQVEVGRAAIAFVALRSHFKNWEEEAIVFNDDKEVTEAIINRKDFVEMGLVHD